jgi:hypothetical protein
MRGARVTAAHSPTPADQPAPEDDRWCWQQAARLRREHPAWVIIWLARDGEFRAYGRLPGARRDSALIATTPTRLAALIGQAEQAARRAPAHPKDPT